MLAALEAEVNDGNLAPLSYLLGNWRSFRRYTGDTSVNI
jgi:hypothetical protein